MTLYEVFTIVGVFLGIGIGLFNYFDKRRNTSLTGVSVSADANKDLNESVTLAYQRARNAEEEKDKRDKEHKDELAQLREEFRIETQSLNDKIAELKKQIDTIAYEISLVAHLGEDPKIASVVIKRIPANKK